MEKTVDNRLWRNNDGSKSIRNYMFIMRSGSGGDELYNNKLYEALTSINAFDNIEHHKYIIRHSFETIELIKDKVLNRPVYDLNYH
jgi:hypothetical protein